MAKRKPDILPYRIFVGERPWEELSTEEQAEYSRKMVDRMGRVFNDYFGLHPEVYAKFTDIREQEGGAQ